MADVIDMPPSAPRRRRQPAPPPVGWQADLARTKAGKLIACVSNAISILTHDEEWNGVLAWDEFAQQIVALKPPPWCPDDAPATTEPGDWTDADTIRAQAWLQRRWSLQIGRESTWDALAVVAHRRRFHPVREYLDGLRWDGELRLDSWLSRFLGAEQTDYTAMVGRSFLVGAVARIYRPGCKVDTMPVLEGRQGIRKSSALRVIFGQWFSDTPIDLQSKDRFSDLRRKWGIEMAELDSLGRADANRAKSYISSPCDNYRPPYGRSNVEAVRQCVFAGTTNAETYLTDTTGNRRFWPVRCGVTRAIDLAGLTAARDQLWAEARCAFEGGAAWWPEPELEQLAAAEQSSRVHVDAWQSVIEGYLGRLLTKEVTIGDVLDLAIGLDKTKWGQGEQNRAARCLRLAGWQRVQRRRDGRVHWVYVPSEEIEQGSGEAQPSPVGGQTGDGVVTP